jgi:septum formation protein
VPAAVDEDAVKAQFRATGKSALDCAETLAVQKACKVSQAHPGALVIGADQMLDCQGTWFDKPRDLAAAQDQLLSLNGKTHLLPTAAVVVRDGAPVWHHLSSPRLTMRSFDAVFAAAYLERAGATVLQSVGVYQLESVGIQLFQAIEGDYFTILGLPLLPLLAYLRSTGVGSL